MMHRVVLMNREYRSSNSVPRMESKMAARICRDCTIDAERHTECPPMLTCSKKTANNAPSMLKPDNHGRLKWARLSSLDRCKNPTASSSRFVLFCIGKVVYILLLLEIRSERHFLQDQVQANRLEWLRCLGSSRCSFSQAHGRRETKRCK